MASIGNFFFHQFRFNMPRVRRPYVRLEPFAGVDNYVLVRGQPRIDIARGSTAIQLPSRAAAQGLLSSYLNSIGYVVNVVDQFGILFTQCTILNVESTPSDNIGGARLDAVWSLDVPLYGV